MSLSAYPTARVQLHLRARRAPLGLGDPDEPAIVTELRIAPNRQSEPRHAPPLSRPGHERSSRPSELATKSSARGKVTLIGARRARRGGRLAPNLTCCSFFGHMTTSNNVGQHPRIHQLRPRSIEADTNTFNGDADG